MQRAMARQAEAERERRAKVINAEGEFQAAAEAGRGRGRDRPNPVTLQLRYLQTLLEIGANQASTIVFPLPIDLIEAFQRWPRAARASERRRAASRATLPRAL